MTHLLRGRYSSVFAPTGTCANPVGSPLLRLFASFEESLQVATSPCCQRDLPDVISESLSCDARAPTTTVCRLLLPVTSSASSAFPNDEWVGFTRIYPLKRLHSGRLFVGCSHSFMFRPHSLFATLVAPTTTVSCRAVSDFYVRAERALLPPHAPDILAVRNR